jgi:cytochrome c-type biogenesis protein CcmH/NrfF
MILLVVLAAGLTAAPNPPVTEAAYRRVGEKLICQCGCMQSVYGCNHYGCPQSDGLRREVREALASTSTEDDALSVMVKKYGQKILAEPETHGFSLSAWVMPFFVLGAGGLLIMVILQAWRKTTRARVAGAAPMDDALIDKYAKRIDEEVDKD